MTTEAWVRSERMAIFPMLLLVEFPHNKTTPDSLLAILLPCKKQMPNRMRENTTHIHSIWQENKHNSLTALMPMVTSLTTPITAINRHQRLMSHHTVKSSQRTIDRHRLPPNCYTFKQPWGRTLLKVPSFYRYFSRNPFVIQKPCPSFCIPKSFSDYSQARSRDHLCKVLVIIPF